MNCIWRGHIEFGVRNVLWRGKINLPKGMFDQQLFRSIFRNFWPGGELFDGGENFPVSLRAAVDFRKLGIHFYV